MDSLEIDYIKKQSIELENKIAQKKRTLDNVSGWFIVLAFIVGLPVSLITSQQTIIPVVIVVFLCVLLYSLYRGIEKKVYTSQAYIKLVKSLDENKRIVRAYDIQKWKEENDKFNDEVRVIDSLYPKVFNHKLTEENIEDARQLLSKISFLTAIFNLHVSEKRWLNDASLIVDTDVQKKIDDLKGYPDSLRMRINQYDLHNNHEPIKTTTLESPVYPYKTDANNKDRKSDSVKLVSLNPQRNIVKATPKVGSIGSYNNNVVKIDHLKKHDSNIELGMQGELIVLNWEKDRLISNGYGDLSDKIVHASREVGDSAGYDILSFDVNGEQILIEVKTTTSEKQDGFYLTANEYRKMLENSNYYIYRVMIKENGDAELLIINGNDVVNLFDLLPSQFIAKRK
ncbi:MAG: DUF3883 domain-containing protein [Rhodocyclaceae bacterium]|nr:DUF3883 domain-containing protein [Rhodocyclaceae bacterium]